MYTFVESLAISLHLVYLLISLSSTTAAGTSFISIFHFDMCDIVICLFFFFSPLSLSICPTLSGIHYPIWECRWFPGDIFRNDPRELRWGPEENGMKTSKWGLLRCNRKDVVIILFAQEWGSFKPAFNGPLKVCALGLCVQYIKLRWCISVTYFLVLIVLVKHLQHYFVK